MKNCLRVALLLVGLGTFAVAQSSGSGSGTTGSTQSGGTLGIDTTPAPATTASLNALLNGQITTNVTNLTGALATANNPGTQIPPVDPYVRDSNGNLVYDANGQPIKKSADQIAAEEAERQKLIDAANQARAASDAAAAANAAGSTQPSISFSGVTVTPEMVEDGQVADPGTDYRTNEHSTANDVPPSDFEGANGEIQNASGDGGWRSDEATGLTVDRNDATVIIDASVGQAGIAAIQNMLGGGPGVPVVGDPSNPVIMGLPPVCRCCGAPLHDDDHVLDGYNSTYTNGYGQLRVVEVHDEFWSQECLTWVPTQAGSYVEWEWFGPGADPGFAQGSSILDSGCRDFLIQEQYWNPVNNSFRFVTDPIEISTHNLPPLNEGWSYYSYYLRADVPIYIRAKVCDNGHRQDKPCPVQ